MLGPALNLCTRVHKELLQIGGIPQILDQVPFIRTNYFIMLAVNAKPDFAVIVLQFRDDVEWRKCFSQLLKYLVAG